MDDLAPAPQAIAALDDTGEPRVSQRLYALKDRDTFLVADAFGDVLGQGDGLFHNDTRILSRFQLFLGSHAEHVVTVNGSSFRVWGSDTHLVETGAKVWLAVEPDALRAVSPAD